MSTSAPHILVACVGNIFLGDDAFGVEMAPLLLHRQYPSGVEICDFGIRGADLAYALLGDYDALILVDAVPRGGAPGTLYLIEPELSADPVQGDEAGRLAIATHSMDPAKVLAFARALGACLPRTLIVGCEPTPLAGDHEEMRMELSAPVRAALAPAVRMVEELIEALIEECPPARERVESEASS
jgi:hydrogenase maturation protease